MFVPFVFTMDTDNRTENYFFWAHFYWYTVACVKNDWPIIAPERYFKRFSNVEHSMFGMSLKDVFDSYGLNQLPTNDNMQVLKAYPFPEVVEKSIISRYSSTFECWIDLQRNNCFEFERAVEGLLNKIIEDFNEMPKGILVFEHLPKSLQDVLKKKGIPVIFQGGGVLRPPLTRAANAFSIIDSNDAKAVKSRYDKFINENSNVPMLTRKGILRLFVSEQYLKDIHNIDNEPEYKAGILYNNHNHSLRHIGQDFVSDSEMRKCVVEKYDKVLIRTRPGYEALKEALDNSPSCFHFCCKCERVFGFTTKGMFEAMLAGRIAHEFGSFIVHSFCNEGIDDNSKEVAPLKFVNFVVFGLCIPFAWLTCPDYLNLLLSNSSEESMYMYSFEHFTSGISDEDLQFYYMTSGREYRLGDTLYFSRGHKPHEYGSYYCIEGLHELEDVCTWSNGNRSVFEFDLTEPINEPLSVTVILYGVATAQGDDAVQTVTCEVNDVDCEVFRLKAGKKYIRFTIPAEHVSEKLRITFKYDYIHSSGNANIAVAFEQIYICRAGQRAFEETLFDEITQIMIQHESMEAYISELEVQQKSMAAYIGELENQQKSMATYIAELETQHKSLTTYIDELEAQRKAIVSYSVGLETQINAIYTLRSWRIRNCIVKILSKIGIIKK